MEELYPKNVLTKLSQASKLSLEDKTALTQLLGLEDLKKLIEQDLFDPTALIHPSTEGNTKAVILSLNEVRELIKLYQVVKNNKLIESKHVKVSELIFWFSYQNEPLPYIASPTVAELLLASPEKIVQLREFITKNSAAMKAWVDLRKEILAVNNLPQGNLNERRLKAKEINEKLAIPEISDFIIDITGHELLKQEYRLVNRYLFQHLNASVEQLVIRSKEFIINLFKKNNRLIENTDTDIAFYNKLGGKQLGKIMQIKYKDLKDNNTKTMRYYIKTHLGGSSHSTGSVEGVDPKELFVYKVLEYIGYGPKSHFYTNPVSIAGFYIATQDTGFTRNPQEKNKFFKTYEELKPEIALQQQNGFALETKKGVIAIDIISRIFVLTDVATNASNIGRVTVNEVRKKWKIIDFDIRTLTFDDLKIFDGFKAGNGTFSYTENIKKIVRKTKLPEKVAIAVEIINELESGNPRHINSHRKMPFLEAIKQAFIFIVKYIKEHAAEMRIDLNERLGELRNVNESELWEILHLLPIEKTGEFGKYVRCNEQNFNLLAQGIRSYHPENPPAASEASSSLKPP